MLIEVRGVVGQAHAVADAAAVPEVGFNVIGVRRQAQRVVVLDVAHRPVVEQAVAAADDVLALAVDVPRGVDAREREGAAVRQARQPGAHRCRRSRRRSAACTSRDRGTSPRSDRRATGEVAALAVQLLVVRPLAETHAVFQREVRLELPAVLREGVHVPVPELAIRHAGERLALDRRALRRASRCGPTSMSAAELPVPFA